jgi:hypothetical protein
MSGCIFSAIFTTRKYPHSCFAFACIVCVAPCCVLHSAAGLDGAFFGTTFPHLLGMVYPEIVPARPQIAYIPRVFGYKLHKSVYDRPAGSAAAAGPVAGSAPGH